MATGNGTTTASLGWESCPEELIRIIIKQLSLKCLLSCMTVNRKWKDIVVNFIEFHSLWPKIFSETIENEGRTYQRKSVLSFKEMVMNSMLWPFLLLAKINLHHIYSLENTTKIQMHVYKENLILKMDLQTGAHIRYFNITNKQLTRSVESSANEIDYTENDYMVVRFGCELHAYGKTDPDDTSANKNSMFVMDNVLLYRLEDNICYVVTKRNVIFALIWNGQHWDCKSRGRYYGNALDTICEINVFNGRVCMGTKLGFIVCEDLKLKSFHKVNRPNSEASLQDSTILVLFNQNGVAVSVSNSHRPLEVFQQFKSNYIALECRAMTCAIEHGEVMFMGFQDGAVAICTVQTMPFTRALPDRLFYVQDFDKSIDEPAVLALEVFEDKLSHHLFVATRRKVLQLLITYPDHIKACYE